MAKKVLICDPELQRGVSLKRRINILFFVGALIFVLTGCGADNENHGLSVENPQKISVWNYYNGTQAVAFENMVNQFNAGIGKEKGIIYKKRFLGAGKPTPFIFNLKQNNS